MNNQEIQDQIWERLQSVTVATITSLRRGEGKCDLWYDSRSELFHLGSYDADFESVTEALEFYTLYIDNEASIEIKEL